jgi:hypothetical protein
LQQKDFYYFQLGPTASPKKIRESANPTLVHKSDHKVFQFYPTSSISP